MTSMFNYAVNALRTVKEAVVEEYRTNFVAKPAVARVLSSTTQLFKQGMQDLVESNLPETTGLLNARDTVEALKDLSVVLETPSALQTVGRVLAEQPEKVKKINQLAIQGLQTGVASVGRGITTVAFAGIDAVHAGIKAASKVGTAIKAALPDANLVRAEAGRVKAVEGLYAQAKARTYSLLETPVRSVSQIGEAVSVQETLLNQLGHDTKSLLEARNAYAKECLKFAGKAALVVGVVVVTGLVLKAVFTKQPVKEPKELPQTPVVEPETETNSPVASDGSGF